MMADLPPPGRAHALVIGAARAFGAEIVGRLQADGLAVADDMMAVPADAPLTVLIINLTISPGDIRFGAVTESDFRAVLDSQLYTLVEAVQAAVPRLAAGSAIVLIVPKSYLGGWGGVHVAATAAACIAMARSMALELAPLGIRVNSVATGRPGESWDRAAARADIAATAAWLAGPGSGQVTGETILVDRGASLHMAQATRRQ